MTSQSSHFFLHTLCGKIACNFRPRILAWPKWLSKRNGASVYRLPRWFPAPLLPSPYVAPICSPRPPMTNGLWPDCGPAWPQTESVPKLSCATTTGPSLAKTKWNLPFNICFSFQQSTFVQQSIQLLQRFSNPVSLFYTDFEPS